MTDSELRSLLRDHPAQGQKALYDQYANYLYAVIARYLGGCGSQEDIEDCFVETFTDVMRHSNRIMGESVKSYLAVAGRNRALTYRERLAKHQQRNVPLEDCEEPSASYVEERQEQRELHDKLMQEINALGQPDATILIQKYFYGKKMADIARMVGLSVNAAQVRCSRALKSLRRNFADWR